MSTETLTSTFADIRLRLLHMASRMLGNEDDANDALQDAFYRLWKHKDEIESRSQAEALSVTTVKHLCIDSIRKQSSSQQISIDEIPEVIQDSPIDNSDLYEEIHRIIDFQLTDVQRKIIAMRDEQDMSYEIIAQEVNMTPANVRVQISRARKIVRDYYRKIKQNET